MGKNTIVICMGSSCLARGNGRNLEIIEQYLFRKQIKDKVIVKGTLCEEECTQGPNIIINGKIFHKVCSSDVEKILERELSIPEMKEDA